MIDWEDIITKNIIKGMGIEPSKNKYINWNTIFNFVPKYSGESNDRINEFDSNETIDYFKFSVRRRYL